MPTTRSRSRLHIPGRKALIAIPLVVLPVAVAADLASIALVKMAVPDDAIEAARAGVNAIQFDNAATPQTAETAFTAAAEVAGLHRLALDEKSFTVFADGSVELTARRGAPTLLFKHVPWFRDHTETTASVRSGRSNW